MKRNIFALAVGALLFALCFSADAQQQTEKIFRIGFLDSGTASGSAVHLEAFRQGMSELGWIERKNITIESRFGEAKPERLPELAAELVRLKVDLIVVASTPASLAAKRASTAIPIVMASVPDPVAAGLVASLAQPGGNVTGLSSLSPELNTKRLEILTDAVPKLTRVGLLWRPGTGIGQSLQLKELRSAAAALKLKLDEIETEADAKSLENAVRSAKEKQVGAITTTSSTPFFAERKRIVELVAKYRLPAIYTTKEYVVEGGLMSYGVDALELRRRTAVYVDKILKGAKPADLPVERPTKFQLIISLKTAKQIGLTIPPNVLARADRVIR
jgi:putative ABC transport system substrate-binding protein